MIALLWAANVLGWPILQIAIGFVGLRLSPQIFESDTWITAPRSWERDGQLYRDRTAIRRWKHLLPDAAPWFGGFPKTNLHPRNPTYLAKFLIETRRAEIAHWFMLGCLPIFFIWNPPWARWVMAVYAFAANLPCILAQRYNRLVLSRIARTRRRTFVQI